MNTFTLILFMLFISACGKAPEMNDGTNSTSVQNSEPLTGKTDSEVIALKYQNQIDLNCAVSIKGQVSDSFNWRVLDEASLMRLLNFVQEDTEVKVAVKISREVKISERNTHTDQNRHEYALEHSPSLKVTFRRDSTQMLQNGSVHDSATFSDVTLYENIPVVLYQRNNELFSCTLTTKIHPAYLDQWKMIK